MNNTKSVEDIKIEILHDIITHHSGVKIDKNDKEEIVRVSRNMAD